ncbi:secretory phospholipase A2 receptor [Paramormyrops kingsleyae]|uniref:secretory phospholipase A2 receptor n=1 Tax=Paramormyrops kingsleyae TaxID=1676925 RepID=UPI003B96B29B
MGKRRLIRRKAGAAGALLALCALLSGCVAGEDEVLEKRQLSELYNKGVFILESVQLKRCIRLDRTNLVLESCERPTRGMLWKWVSRHRLFNLGGSLCLGLNTSDALQPLGTFQCDAPLRTLWWRCSGDTLFGASQFRLAVTGRLVVAKRTAYHQWRRYFTTGEGPCANPYEEIHTLLGNAQGMPCALPFKYNSKWYPECTSEGREDHYRWCATTSRYDQDEKWGFCPSTESGCDTFWDQNAETRACYQFNLYSIMTWGQAHSSCWAQGGGLLSITDLTEQKYIRDRLNDVGVVVWIGLNHLDENAGWNWSDGAPLALVNFTEGITAPSRHERQCGVYNSTSGHPWQSLSCESALPYICKKTPNDSRRAEPFGNWQHYGTVCAEGWTPQNRFCYKVLEEPQSWPDASASCRSLGANLTSVHSLADVELLLGLLANQSSLEAWIGLRSETSVVFEWSDGTPTSVTFWHRHEPDLRQGRGPLCAKTHREHGNWLLAPCGVKLPSVCRKLGLIPIREAGAADKGCAQGWKRRRHFCYKVSRHQQSYEDAMKGYYCGAALVTVMNRFEQAFLNSLINTLSMNSSQYYWTALQDRNRSGEYSWLAQNGWGKPLLYTNWNRHQPVSAGGCVALTGGQALGRWEVKDCKSHKALSICKQRIGSRQETQESTVHINGSAPCPTGWHSKPGLLHCYKVFHSEKILMKRSWTEADFFCQALGANLASFRHYNEEAFVKETLGTMFTGMQGRSFWVGFNKRSPWTFGSWEWSDGTPVVTSFIEDKNSEDDEHNCAVFTDSDSLLVPQPCDSKHEWICKVPRGAELTKPYWYTEQHQAWVFFRGAEYYFDQQPFPWNAVSFACNLMGANLASIHSLEELNFIKERMEMDKDPSQWWIGLSSDTINEEYSWSDGAQLQFQNWPQAEPQKPSPQSDVCVSMSSQTGKWSGDQCGDRHGYVCKRRILSVLEIPRQPHYIGGCPEKWLYFGHKCLFLHLPKHPEEGKTWQESQTICSSSQGSLVTIEDEIEQAYITMLLPGSTADVWIGLQDDDHWVNGKSLTYTNWSPVDQESGISDYYGPGDGKEPLCTLLSNNHNFHFTGKWYSEKCSATGYGFVCQKPQDPTKPPSQSYFHPLPDPIEYENRSYRVVRGNLSWYEALNRCLERETQLASITDPHHQAFLTVLVNKLALPHWIGLYSQDDGISYRWSDDSDTAFMHWDSGDDEDEDTLGDCVYMDITGAWKRADCEETLQGALCQAPPPKSNVVSYEVTCPDRWIKFKNSCYSFEPIMQRQSLEEARERCRHTAKSSDLLTVKSEEENRFVLEKLKSYALPHQTVWLAILYDANVPALSWFDGSAILYSNWHFKAPSVEQLSSDTCVSMRASDSVWHLSHCGDKLGFVCKITADAVNEVEVEPLNGLHHGVIPAAALVAILIFALLVVSLWCVYKRNGARFRRFPFLGSAYYRQASSQAVDSDVLITDLEGNPSE